MRNVRIGRITTALLLALALSLGTGGLLVTQALQRVDLLIYDSLVRQLYRAPSSRIVIVAIDEKSLKQLGRWPWSRSVHAELLTRLTQFGARGVMLDILMPEPEIPPHADRKLAESIRLSGRTVLALAPEQGAAGDLISESLPIPELAAAAAALGHVDVELDVDGLCRSVYLYAGLGSPYWPNLSLALVQAGFPDLLSELSSERHPDREHAANPHAWVRDQRVLIPFSGPTGHFKRLSYVDVLEGRVDASDIVGRLVLVGATAAGLGDALATPATQARDRMPGVEMHANIANALLEGIATRRLSTPAYYLLTLLIVFLSALTLAFLSRRGLAMVAGAVVVVLLLSGILLMGFHLWFPPAVAMVAISVAYPLWNWLQRNAEYRAMQSLRHRIEHHIHHDHVTGLPNRELLLAHMRQALLDRDGAEGRMVLLFIHLERRGVVGNSLFFSANESLSRAMADRLRGALREADLVAYLSNDDFAVFIDGPVSLPALHAAAGRLHDTFQRPLTNHQDTEISVVPRIGASLFPDDGSDAQALMDNAFAAMFKARENESKGLCFFTPELGDELRSRSELERLLQYALQRGELDVHYQPQVRAEDGAVIGMEVLVRWNNPTLGSIGPDVFIPVAERTGVILHIGQWVLEQACRQARRWEDQGLGALRVAVNISPVQFAQTDIVEIVSGALTESGLPATQLELEITEGVLLQDVEATTKALSELKRRGVNIAIDDFGTGYSSLSYLKRLPLDRLKIDRSFIVEIGRSSDSNEITQAIIAMAHRLKLQVIAEGVETEGQADFLKTFSCDEIQGFLYGRPVSAEEMELLLTRQRDG